MGDNNEVTSLRDIQKVINLAVKFETVKKPLFKIKSTYFNIWQSKIFYNKNK
jgi:hypothetical protein